jgi:hypothetical protein
MDFGLKVIVWYDRKLRLWCATYRDSMDNQVGDAGYGPTKPLALDDLKGQNVQ